MLFVTVWAINYRTCIRLKAACDGLVYRKIFELKNLHQSGSSSETITLISSDIQRIFDAVRQSLLMIGGPILMVGGTIYSVWLLGWMALVGAGLLILFYPVQVRSCFSIDGASGFQWLVLFVWAGQLQSVS
jgi:ABC-type multidrug transport system fused ATPase/permease subunit